MDQPAPRRRARRAAIAVASIAAIALFAAALVSMLPQGLRVSRAELRIVPATPGLLRDEAALRATAAPLHSVMLDAVESGRVEVVVARDGSLVAQGELLFRLSNPQRRLELLERESERAQQISNSLNLRIALEAGQAARDRRLSDLRFALEQAVKQHARQEKLASQGFVSVSALEESGDHLEQQRRLYEAERASHANESRIKRDALLQMQQAIARMESGLQLVNATVAALEVRAPVAGRLTDFQLEVGSTVRQGQALGRIDDPASVKLSALVDEYYLSRVAVGRPGVAIIDGRRHALAVSRIYPQVKENRFTVELAFAGAPPAGVQPGQSMEILITLGEPASALLLPNDAFAADTSGLAAFVLNAEGTLAERRAIRTGRRNHHQVEVLAGLAPGERVIVSSYAAFGKATRLELHP